MITPAIIRTCLLCLLFCAPLKAEKQVLFIAGAPSHGEGEHRFPEGSQLLAQALNQSAAGVRAEVSPGWPADAALFDKADCIVLYSDGLDHHVAKGHLAALQKHLAAGKGLVVMHFALEPTDPEMQRFLEEAVGGWFEVNWSVNPVWTLETPRLSDHPITRGVELKTVKDEWYYHLRFRTDIIPVLQALPPSGSISDKDGARSGNPAVRQALADGIPQTLAWAVVNANGSRGFGFTGGHFHHNWGNDGVRKLVLNAIVWAAGIEPPATGVASTVPPLLQNPTIDQAIARGDLEDVKRHLALHPAALNQGARPGVPPLHQAILRNKTEIALFLLDASADPDLPDSSQRTPLHLAVERKNIAVVKKLMALKAKPNQRDDMGWTPLHQAAARNLREIATVLLDGGADGKTLSARGGTPLHEAAVGADKKFLQLLLQHGIDPTVKSLDGRTALDIAKEFKNEAAIEILAPLTDQKTAVEPVTGTP